jgi:peptidoglycan hydrolase CwlO-like protein
MMRKTLVTTIAVLTTAMLFSMTSANASIYTFTFQSSDAELTATGEFTVNAADQVTSVSGAVAGLTNQVISRHR